MSLSEARVSAEVIPVPCADERRNVLDFQGLRLRAGWERCFISLGDAEQLARHKFHANEAWGRPLAASAWVDEERGNLKLFVADYANGKRLSARCSRNVTISFGRTPPLEHGKLVEIATASAGEAGTAETTKIDSVHEHAPAATSGGDARKDHP